MQIETMKETLQWTTGFHNDLSEILEESSKKNEDKRAKMLLSYLAEHEEKVAEMVDQYERSSSPNALNTWCYEYVSHHPIINHEHDFNAFDTLNATQIMELIVEQHEQLIALYDELSSKEQTKSAHELAESLKQLEKHEMMRISQSANRLEDL